MFTKAVKKTHHIQKYIFLEISIENQLGG